MSAVEGTWKDGRIELNQPVDWPEGCRVVIEPLPDGESVGMREENWSDSPEAVAEWLQWYDNLEPLEITPEEEAEIAAWRAKIKEYTIANMYKGIEGMFE